MQSGGCDGGVNVRSWDDVSWGWISRLEVINHAYCRLGASNRLLGVERHRWLGDGFIDSFRVIGKGGNAMLGFFFIFPCFPLII